MNTTHEPVLCTGIIPYNDEIEAIAERNANTHGTLDSSPEAKEHFISLLQKYIEENPESGILEVQII